MNERINPTTPIPIVSNPIPDEEREITIAKSNIEIPNAIFFIKILLCKFQFVKLKVILAKSQINIFRSALLIY